MIDYNFTLLSLRLKDCEEKWNILIDFCQERPSRQTTPQEILRISKTPATTIGKD